MKAFMHPQFGQLMKDATSLTQAGDLQAAMAAINRALGRAGTADDPSPHTNGDVIDVEARVLDVEPAAPAPVRPQTETADQFVSGHFSHRAGARDYRLFIPSPRPDRPRALIVMLHGCTQNPDDFARGTRMNALAAEYNALVLYPAQNRQANPQGCWNWFKHTHQRRERGEPAILSEMAKHIAQSHGVDPAHVYVAGLSAGGAMAAILATTHPDVFTAAGVHSGLAAGAARDLPGALAAMQGKGPVGVASANASNVRMIVFHGDADATVHASNGDHVAHAHRSGSSGDEQTRLDSGGRSCTRRIHKDGSGKVLTEQWLIHGAGHAWSGGDPSGSYADARGPDASAEMLRFFFER